MDMDKSEEAQRESTPSKPTPTHGEASLATPSEVPQSGHHEQRPTVHHAAPSTETNREARTEGSTVVPKEVQRDAREGRQDRGDRAEKAAEKTRPKRVKNNVRKIRMEKMMSKAELARRAGMSTLTIDRVERGLPCRMDTKRKILEALGLKPSDRVMVFGEDD